MRAIKVENFRIADCGQWERKEFVGCPWFGLGHTVDMLLFLRIPGELRDTRDNRRHRTLAVIFFTLSRKKMCNLHLKSLEGAIPCPSQWTMTAYWPRVSGGTCFKGCFPRPRLPKPFTPMRTFDIKLRS